MVTIKSVREEKNWSQTELAERAGVSFPTVSRAENKHPISKTSAKHICAALEISLEEVSDIVLTQRKRKA